MSKFAYFCCIIVKIKENGFWIYWVIVWMIGWVWMWFFLIRLIIVMEYMWFKIKRFVSGQCMMIIICITIKISQYYMIDWMGDDIFLKISHAICNVYMFINVCVFDSPRECVWVHAWVHAWVYVWVLGLRSNRDRDVWVCECMMCEWWVHVWVHEWVPNLCTVEHTFPYVSKY